MGSTDMNDPTETLAAVIAGLDRDINDINGKIDQARAEIEQAKQTIGKLTASQTQLTNEIAALRQQPLTGSPASYEAQTAELNKQISAHQQQMTSNSTAISQQNTVLQQLIAANKEQPLRSQLERQKGQFVVRLGAVLNSIKDGAVRYIAATRAIEACRTRNVGPNSFQSLADQKTASDMLDAFVGMESNASAADRAEAQRFDTIRALSQDLSLFRQQLSQSVAGDDQRRQSLAERKVKEETAVKELSSPETADALKSRHLKRNVAIALGVLLAVVAVIAFLVSADWAIPVAIVALVLAGICFVIARANSDAGRQSQLESHRAALQACNDEIAKLASDVAAHGQQAQQQIDSFAARLTAANISPTTSPASLDARLQCFLDAAQQAEQQWQVRHPEVWRLG